LPVSGPETWVTDRTPKSHVVHLSDQSVALLKRADRREALVFSPLGTAFPKFWSNQTLA
jgi:hypothetical protein